MSQINEPVDRNLVTELHLELLTLDLLCDFVDQVLHVMKLLSRLCCGNVHRSDSLPMAQIMQKLKKIHPFTDLPKETQNIL